MTSATFLSYLSKFSKDRVNIVGPFASFKNLREPIVFVDGGAKSRLNGEGITVGDGDSFHVRMDVELNPVKDFSDLAFVLEHLKGFKTLRLWGFEGGRKDHEIMNLGELHHFLKRSPGMIVLDTIVMLGEGKWELDLDGDFSVFAFEPTQLSLGGECHYQLDNAKLRELSSHGLSNVASGVVQFKTSSPIVVFRN